MSIAELSWPMARLGEGIEELCRRAGLRPTAGETSIAPETVQNGGADLERWMEWIAERLGVEAKPVEATIGSMEAMLLGGGPALLQYSGSGEPSFFLLLTPRFGKARLLGPDLKVRTCSIATLRNVLCEPYEAPLFDEVDRLLTMAQVSPDRGARVRSVIARERLASKRIGGCWLFRLPATRSFWRQVQQVRIPHKLAAMMALFAAVYALEILGWSVIGNSALNGRLDLGWLAGWILLVISIIPLRLLGSWIDSTVAVDIGRLLKTRLLVGALHLDIEAVRHQGVGQLLGRVMESQAFEALALGGGLAALVAVVELAFSAWVLSMGAGGTLHVVLLMLWLAISVGLALRYLTRLRDWTLSRLDLTHELVERMVGHRTTLAQEWPARRDQQQDRGMKDYLTASVGIDRAVIPFLSGIPVGWMLLGLAGLIPAFLSGSGTPAGLAIGVGGVFLANRAFSGIAAGLASGAQAVIAWRLVGPLFNAADRTAPEVPFVSTEQMKKATGSGPRLIEAEGLSLQYEKQSEPVLKNASLTIEHGDRVLVEGSSGGGKSTLASLLVGLRKPDSGLLLLNGLDRHTLGETWHQFATEAPQFHENHVLSGTIAFNLLMGRNWPATDDELKEAQDVCTELGLDELIKRMPSGMMQTVGETGWQLSHGERSRLFLARALLQNAELTVLDESFAALDPETLETCLDCAMRRAKTLMVIAHP